MLENHLCSKMHGSAGGIKAFHGKLWRIEAIDSKFTFPFAKPAASKQRHSNFLVSPKF
jgi:hypothetical protein